ncbi:A disintegrin and metalloproteinase with thrombospondin motifs like [Tubulanus polymorphus]|uniref:A disintegrin and metalloproteinase with thrombospondin motifs like n=1 Tax=Tubulanus polymorphus TaxID=672921 RepID=UPI003DA32C46
MLLVLFSCSVFTSMVLGVDVKNLAVYDVTRRSLSESETHPELLAFRLEFPEDSVILHLQRRDSLNVHQAPVFVTGEDGELKRLQREKPESVPYQSLDKRAAVTVTTKRTDSGRVQRSLMGTFDLNGDGNVYCIERSEQPVSDDKKRDVTENNDGVIHTITKRTLKIDSDEEIDIFRRKKTTYPTYYVELFVLIDFSTYSLYGKNLQKTIEHYSQVVNGIDLIFGAIEDPALQIRIRVTGFFVAQSAEAAPWTDSSPFKETTKRGYKIKPGDVKKLAKVWLEERAGKLPTYDHVQLYTGIPLRSIKPDGTVSAAAGVSGGVCGNSASLVRSAPKDIIRTGPAHEIGHSLGAKHDTKYESECPKKVGSVMGGGPPYTFSKCAIRDMKKKMEKLNKKNANCLLNRGFNEKGYAKIIEKLPGQFYSADEQCKMKRGPKSVNCVSKGGFNCDNLMCADDNGRCYQEKLPPAYGTSCGNKMWCIRGKCSYDEKAPEN